MATTDTQIQQLVINVGTKAQIESAIAGGTITQDMLSVATDGDTYIQGVKVNGTELTPDSNNKVNVTVPTDTGDLTNNAGFITGITLSDVVTALGYTPYNSTNPNGYQANVLEGVQVNGTDLTITNKKVNVSVPTQASDIDAQPTLVSGTNIKTVNGNSLLGSGDLVISGLPSQTSQSGKFLTTNGTSASWANIPTEIPSQTGQNGKFLTTNGSSVSWATVDALPIQTGNSGKYLTTNGTSASWGEIAEYTAQEVETLWGSL